MTDKNLEFFAALECYYPLQQPCKSCYKPGYGHYSISRICVSCYHANVIHRVEECDICGWKL